MSSSLIIFVTNKNLLRSILVSLISIFQGIRHGMHNSYFSFLNYHLIRIDLHFCFLQFSVFFDKLQYTGNSQEHLLYHKLQYTGNSQEHLLYHLFFLLEISILLYKHSTTSIYFPENKKRQERLNTFLSKLPCLSCPYSPQ